MSAQKNTTAKMQLALETYHELARARRASSKLRSSSSRRVEESQTKYDDIQDPKKTLVRIIKQGGVVTVVLGEAKPITEANRAKILSRSRLSIPEYRTIKNSMKRKP